jgi:hypothetical protein
MNERVLETAHLEALLMGAPPGRVSTVHLHCVPKIKTAGRRPAVFITLNSLERDRARTIQFSNFLLFFKI